MYSGGCLVSSLRLVSRSACTLGGGWGVPTGSWSYPPPVLSTKVLVQSITCTGGPQAARERVRGIAWSPAESSQCTPGVGAPSGGPAASSSRLRVLSCACGSGVSSFTSRWAQLHIPGIASTFGVSPGTSRPPCALQRLFLLRHPQP